MDATQFITVRGNNQNFTIVDIKNCNMRIEIKNKNK